MMKLKAMITGGAIAIVGLVGVAASAAPAKASTVTDAISFTLDDADVSAGTGSYDGTAVVKASFDFTYNPSVVVATPTTPISGAISNLSYTVTSALFSGPATFDAINFYLFDYGVLGLSSTSTLTTTLTGTNGITIYLGGFGGGTSPLASVWYSQDDLSATYNATGPYNISIVSDANATPLPSTWTMLVAGFVGLGFFAYRGSKKGNAAFAAA
jgi:hypothetical protein